MGIELQEVKYVNNRITCNAFIDNRLTVRNISYDGDKDEFVYPGNETWPAHQGRHEALKDAVKAEFEKQRQAVLIDPPVLDEDSE